MKSFSLLVSGFVMWCCAMVVFPNIGVADDSTYQWHTFYGSSHYDYASGIATDSSGNTYVTGISKNSWNGPLGQAPLHTFTVGGSSNFYILKLDSNGAYQWHTFYGSGYFSGESVQGITVDGSGNLFVMGEAPATWNGPAGQTPLHAWSSSPGCSNLFIIKLATNGAYQWHTFHGPPSGGDYCTGNIFPKGITADGNGNVYVTGDEAGANWFGPNGQSPINSFNSSYTYNPFVLKLDNNGTYQWHSFYGYHNNGGDTTNAIAVDSSGALIITGTSTTPWTGPGICTSSGVPPCPINDFGTTADPYGSTNIFVMKLTSGGAFQWHTFYGASGWNGTVAYSIAPDSGDNVYVTGASTNGWNGPGVCTTPGVSPCPLHESTTYADIFVLKLSGSGGYQWHTFFGGGGSSNVAGKGITTNGNNVYVAGESWGVWNGPNDIPPLNSSGGSVVLKLTSSGVYQWHTYYGAGADLVSGITLHGGADIYVAGSSDMSWKGPANVMPLHSYTDLNDMFVFKLYDLVSSLPTVTTAPVNSVTQTTASGGGTVTADGGAAVTTRGICWSTSANPAITDAHTSDGSGTGAFTSTISGLAPYTLYHVRAYAINQNGTGYGDDVYFNTPCPASSAYIGSTGYLSIQNAANSRMGAFVIRAVSGIQPEPLVITGTRTITLAGGYDCIGGILIGETTIPGPVTIGSLATVIMSNIVIR